MGKGFEVTDDLLATKGQRFLHYLIDYGMQFVLGGAIGLVVGVVGVFFGKPEIVDALAEMTKIQEYLLGYVILIVYYSLTEVFLKRSIAKFITNTIVVLGDGSIPSSSDFLRRTFCRLIPLNHLSFLGSPCRGWHDSISNTYVVKKKEFEIAFSQYNSLEEIGKNSDEIENSSYKF